MVHYNFAVLWNNFLFLIIWRAVKSILLNKTHRFIYFANISDAHEVIICSQESIFLKQEAQKTNHSVAKRQLFKFWWRHQRIFFSETTRWRTQPTFFLENPEIKNLTPPEMPRQCLLAHPSPSDHLHAPWALPGRCFWLLVAQNYLYKLDYSFYLSYFIHCL